MSIASWPPRSSSPTRTGSPRSRWRVWPSGSASRRCRSTGTSRARRSSCGGCSTASSARPRRSRSRTGAPVWSAGRANCARCCCGTRGASTFRSRACSRPRARSRGSTAGSRRWTGPGLHPGEDADLVLLVNGYVFWAVRLEISLASAPPEPMIPVDVDLEALPFLRRHVRVGRVRGLLHPRRELPVRPRSGARRHRGADRTPRVGCEACLPESSSSDRSTSISSWRSNACPRRARPSPAAGSPSTAAARARTRPSRRRGWARRWRWSAPSARTPWATRRSRRSRPRASTSPASRGSTRPPASR